MDVPQFILGFRVEDGRVVVLEPHGSMGTPRRFESAEALWKWLHDHGRSIVTTTAAETPDQLKARLRRATETLWEFAKDQASAHIGAPVVDAAEALASQGLSRSHNYLKQLSRDGPSAKARMIAEREKRRAAQGSD